MDQSEREFLELARRYRPQSGSATLPAPTDEDLARWRDLMMHHVRGGGTRGREALWYLLEAALRELVRFLSPRVDSHEHAEDLAQKVVTSVLKAYDNGSRLRLEHGTASFYDYLFTAARHEAGRHQTRVQDDHEILTSPEDLPPVAAGVDSTPHLPEFPAGTREFWQWMDQATRHLPQQVHDLVFLAERTGLGDAELSRVLGRPDGTNISQDKKRARKKFIDWFGVLWVARTIRAAAPGAVSPCTALDQRLNAWNPRDESSFTPEVYSLVRQHIRGCATCRLVFIDFTGTGDSDANTSHSSRLLNKFRTLPVAAAPEALREWLESQRAKDDEDRRRTLLEILLTLRRGSSSVKGSSRLPGPIARLTRSAVLQAQTGLAVVARQPAISNALETVRNHSDIARAATVIILLVAGASAAVVLQPDPPPEAAAALPPAATSSAQEIVTASPTPAAATVLIPSPSTQPSTTSRPRPQPDPPASASATCSPTWQTIASPNLGAGFHRIMAGAASAPDDIWVVGQHGWPGVSHTVTMHYDGSEWTVIPSPSPGAAHNALDDVAAVGPDNVWAAGWWYATATDNYHPLLIHWDGTAWTEIPTPSPDGAYLEAITALGPNDIWVIGAYQTEDQPVLPLSLHWDGNSWTRTPIPAPADDMNTLWSVSGTSTSDVWTVGGDYYQAAGQDPGFASGPLIEHWNGHDWSPVPNPSPASAKVVMLYDITAITPTDAWASGAWLDTDGNHHPLLTHWNGHSWQLADLPDFGAGHSEFSGIVALSSSDIWTFGITGYDTDPAGYYKPGTGAPLAMHWDGTAWTVMPAISPAGGSFTDAIKTADHEIWGIGYISRGGGAWYENTTTLTRRLQLC